MNPSLVSRYLFRNLAVSTIIATVMVSLVVWLIESLKFFEMAVNGGAPGLVQLKGCPGGDGAGYAVVRHRALRGFTLVDRL